MAWKRDPMSFVSGVQDPTASPLLPTEAATLAAVGKNPDDYMGLWVQAIPDERGIQIGATHEGLTFVTIQGVMRSAALVSASKLILTPTNAVTLDLAMYGIRLVLAKASCEMPVVPDWGWEVTMIGHPGDANMPRGLFDRFAESCAEGADGFTAQTTTLTLYEAQAIRNALQAAGITSTMRPLPKPEEPTSTGSAQDEGQAPEEQEGDRVWMYSTQQGLPAGLAEDRLSGIFDRLALPPEDRDDLA